jgi:hypothetical protein
MATKKKATDAPASKKPAAKKPTKKDGGPTRAQKKAINKATKASADAMVRDIVVQHKEAGRTEVPPLPTYSGWTSELEDALYTLIATGNGMREISKMHGMPPLVQMLRWLSDETHPFSLTYARGKQAVVSLYEEDIQAISLAANIGEIRTEKQVLTKDGDVVDVVETKYVDNVERSKLAVATMQWTLGHLRPRKHGRSPDLSGDKPNEQLEGLFAALKAGPADAK